MAKNYQLVRIPIKELKAMELCPAIVTAPMPWDAVREAQKRLYAVEDLAVDGKPHHRYMIVEAIGPV